MLGNTTDSKLQLYLVDFGLARENFFEDRVDAEPKSNVSFRGTAAYASLRSLENWEQGKRDDLEGVFWVMVDLLWGGLPWRRLNLGKSKERDVKIRQGKRSVFTALDDMNSGKLALKPHLPKDGVFAGPVDDRHRFATTSDLTGRELLEALPDSMIRYATKLRQLKFNKKPDYEFFKECFASLEEQGNVKPFRNKFLSVTKAEAMCKEIYGYNEDEWPSSKPTPACAGSPRENGESRREDEAPAKRRRRDKSVDADNETKRRRVSTEDARGRRK